MRQNRKIQLRVLSLTALCAFLLAVGYHKPIARSARTLEEWSHVSRWEPSQQSLPSAVYAMQSPSESVFSSKPCVVVVVQDGNSGAPAGLVLVVSDLSGGETCGGFSNFRSSCGEWRSLVTASVEY